MKRTKFLALALVVAVMMMGAGYAYWTESLTINSTVDTGELDVVFTSPEWASETEYMGTGSETYCDLTEDSHVLKLHMNDVYPGAPSTVKFTLENTGTLAAYVDEFTLSNDSKWTIDGTEYSILSVILCDDVNVEGYTEDYSGTTLADAMTYLNSLGDSDKGILLEDADNATNGNNKREVTLKLRFDPEANEDSLPEDSNPPYGFTITTDVYQFNAR